GIAAIGLGRLFLGFEIREDYCKIAVDRFENFKKQRESFQDSSSKIIDDCEYSTGGQIGVGGR
ncbi:MAG: hypothetical protein SVX43_15485, partial [Cyanobacteriota bacterium]|nr:hypothetical protein [Cyanobacteriota bacterium]